MLIHLVRHAMPQVCTDLAPDAWALSAEGARAARELRGTLPSDATVVSSPERKAIETVRLATARDPMVRAQFAEVDRPGSRSTVTRAPDGGRGCRARSMSDTRVGNRLGLTLPGSPPASRLHRRCPTSSSGRMAWC